MDRWPWRWLGGIVIVAALASILFIPDPSASELSTLSNRQLIEMLDSPRSVVREAASSQLLARSRTVVPYLVTAATDADPSHREAIIGLLQELFLSSNLIVAEAAEAALENLSRHANEDLASSAESVLAANANLRHVRAMSQIRLLGGQTRDLDLTSEPIVTGGRGGEPMWTAQSHILVFDANWQGGDEGLKYLLRVYPFDPISLHLTQDAPISAEALQQLRTRRQRVSIRREHESCLGVLVEEARQNSVPGVRFTQVIPNSPAAQAGLRRGDTLTSFNGRAIRTFADLQECAASSRPGDRVNLRIARQSVTYRVKLPLGSDFRTGVCGCLPAPTASE